MAGPGGSNPLRPIPSLSLFSSLSLTSLGGILTMLSTGPDSSNLLVRWLDWLFNHLTGIVAIGIFMPDSVDDIKLKTSENYEWLVICFLSCSSNDSNSFLPASILWRNFIMSSMNIGFLSCDNIVFMCLFILSYRISCFLMQFNRYFFLWHNRRLSFTLDDISPFRNFSISILPSNRAASRASWHGSNSGPS